MRLSYSYTDHNDVICFNENSILLWTLCSDICVVSGRQTSGCNLSKALSGYRNLRISCTLEMIRTITSLVLL